MFRRFAIAFAGIWLTAQIAAAAELDFGHWDQPAGEIAAEDDPEAPFVSYFTPAYQDEAKIAAWSMMAARWRQGGRTDLTIGVRIAHDGPSPWNITAARLADGTELAVDVFAPFKFCSADGACLQREVAAIALSPQTLKNGAVAGMDITLVTATGGERRISFPPDILAQMYSTAIPRP